MDTRISIKNFRVFDNEGASFSIRPITILTGCNSSGKSSIAKALILLNDFLNGIKSEISIPKLDFSKKPLSLLGNFETVINKSSIKDGFYTISISYDVSSGLIGRPLSVLLEFGLEEKDLKKNGFLKKFSVADATERCFFKGNNVGVIQTLLHRDPHKFDFLLQNCIEENTNLSDYKYDFFAYCKTFYALEAANETYTSFSLLGGMEVEDYVQKIKEIRQYLKDVIDLYGMDKVFSLVEYYANNLGSETKASFTIADNCTLIDKAAQTDIIAYLPILDKLDSIKKEDFNEAFINLYKESRGRLDSNFFYTNSFIERIIEDYQNSDFILFSDYYRNLENEYLNTRFMGDTVFDFIENSFTPNDDSIISQSLNLETAIIDTSRSISFETVFGALCHLDPNAPGISIPSNEFLPESLYYHDCLRYFSNFWTNIIQDAFSADICQSLTYISSSRIDVQRLYSVDNKDNFSNALSEYLEARRIYHPSRNYIPGSFINKWVKAFDIGERFEVLPIENGLGVVLKILQTHNDSQGALLADYGYGISQLISILIEIETAILKSEIRYKRKHIVDKDTGKIELERIFEPGEEAIIPRTIVIEEPEIHQHPRFQTKLAEMFVDALINHNIQFILETHSEYLVRRIQTLIAEKDIPLSKEDVSIIYVNNESQAGKQKVRQIEIEDDGRLNEPFGPGFFDEADSLAMKLLKIKGGFE